jgi:multidrug efflux pump subunit AcrA (membrane-fusion protein)
MRGPGRAARSPKSVHGVRRQDAEGVDQGERVHVTFLPTFSISTVELLRRSGRWAAVTSGLQPGDKVIVYPSDRIAENVRIQPR